MVFTEDHISISNVLPHSAWQLLPGILGGQFFSLLLKLQQHNGDVPQEILQIVNIIGWLTTIENLYLNHHPYIIWIISHKFSLYLPISPLAYNKSRLQKGYYKKRTKKSYYFYSHWDQLRRYLKLKFKPLLSCSPQHVYPAPTCVCVKVIPQKGDCSECPATEMALMWSLISVTFHMPIQI